MASKRPSSVGRSTPPLHLGNTCPWTSELQCRVIHEEWRLHPCIWQGGGGFLCIHGEHSLPSVLIADKISPGGGCTCSQLAKSTQVCLSSSETSALRALQNQRGEGISSGNGTEMAKPAVVARTGGDASSSSVDYPAEERPPV